MSISMSMSSLSPQLTIGGETYERATVTSICVREGITSIPDKTFMGCVNLSSISLPSTLLSLGEMAFAYTCKLSSIVIPFGVDFCGEYCFAHSFIKSIGLPSSLRTIERGMFLRCSCLEGIDLRYINSEIKSDAFCGCSNIQSIIIEVGITSLEENSFYRCSRLESITIPNSVTCVKSSVFSYCEKLRSITIPESALVDADYGIGELGYNDPFEGCTKLESIARSHNLELVEYLRNQTELNFAIFALG